MPAKVSVTERPNVTAGLAKLVDAVEPVGRRDVRGHGERHGRGSSASDSPDDGEEAEGRDELAQELRAAGARVAGRRKDRLPEHSVGDRDPAEGAGDLGQDVSWSIAPPESASAASASVYRRI